MPLTEQLRRVEVGEPFSLRGLQIFPLRWQQDSGGLDYRTLDESLAAGLLEVTEVDQGGSVPQLKVHNKGDTHAFLMAGEQLSGGKQNRVLNASILVAPGTELPIPVSCVERGRWAYRSPRFGSCGSSSHSRLRKLMHEQATRSYRACGTPASDQGEVWREVDRKLTETHSHSDTHVLQKAYEDTAVYLASLLDQVPLPPEASGAIFAYNGQIIGFDLFDRPETLAKLWRKLLQAYAIDAPALEGDNVPAVAREAVEEWLRTAAQSREESFTSPGVGQDVRVEGERLTAAGLVVQEHPVHVEAFARTEQAG